MTEYFQIINDENDSFKKALEIIHDPETYSKLIH